MPTITKDEAIQLGYPKNKFFIQTILIDKDISKKNAIKYLKENGYRYNDVRSTTNYNRYMQHNPVENAIYYTKPLYGMELVYQKF